MYSNFDNQELDANFCHQAKNIERFEKHLFDNIQTSIMQIMEEYEEIKYFLMSTCQETSSRPYCRYLKGHQKKKVIHTDAL